MIVLFSYVFFFSFLFFILFSFVLYRATFFVDVVLMYLHVAVIEELVALYSAYFVRLFAFVLISLLLALFLFFVQFLFNSQLNPT